MGYTLNFSAVWRSFDQLLWGLLLSLELAIGAILIGAVIGTIIVEGVSFWLSDNYRDVWPIILGLLLLLVILFRPLGLISFVLGERERVGSFGAKAKEKAKDKPKEKRNAAP